MWLVMLTLTYMFCIWCNGEGGFLCARAIDWVTVVSPSRKEQQTQLYEGSDYRSLEASLIFGALERLIQGRGLIT